MAVVAENIATLFTTNPISTVGSNDLMYVSVNATTDGVIQFVNFAKLFLQPGNNLSDLTNLTLARTNLGLGSAATQTSGTFLQTASNLSDLSSVSTARTNLGLGSAALVAATALLMTANNLSDVASVSAARTNLGLGTAAVASAASFLAVANNLSDVLSASTARANLGLGSAATQPASAFLPSTTSYLVPANNLSDVVNIAAARTNLGLGSAATGTAYSPTNLLPLNSGGTNANLTAALGSVVSSTATAFSLIAPNNVTGNQGVQALFGQPGQAAAFSPYNFPATLTSSTILSVDTSNNIVSTILVSSFLAAANNLSDLVNIASARANLGLGSAATMSSAAFLPSSTSYLVPANNLSDLTSAATARTNLGLGTAATLPASNFLQAPNNLSELTNPATARTNLGLGTAAVAAATSFLANAPASVAYSNIQNVSGSTLLGNASSTAGVVGEIAIGSGLTLSGSTLTASTTAGSTFVPVQSISRSALAGTYANNAGTNATFTIGGTTVTIDTVVYSASTIGQTLGIMGQTSTFQNGVYYLASVGTQLVFQRSPNYNTPALINTSGLIFGNYFGGTYSQQAYYLTAPVVTIGTTAVVYAPATMSLNSPFTPPAFSIPVWTTPSPSKFAYIASSAGILTSTGTNVFPQFSTLLPPVSLTFNTVSTATTMVANQVYNVTGSTQVVLTLPSATAGSWLIINSASTTFKIAQISGQTIVFGNQTTTAGSGGSLTSNNAGASIFMITNTSVSNQWQVAASISNYTGV